MCWSELFGTWNLSYIPQIVKKARVRSHGSFSSHRHHCESQRTICFSEVDLNSVGVQKKHKKGIPPILKKVRNERECGTSVYGRLNRQPIHVTGEFLKR